MVASCVAGVDPCQKSVTTERTHVVLLAPPSPASDEGLAARLQLGKVASVGAFPLQRVQRSSCVRSGVRTPVLEKEAWKPSCADGQHVC
jgi:hypothetical protein